MSNQLHTKCEIKKNNTRTSVHMRREVNQKRIRFWPNMSMAKIRRHFLQLFHVYNRIQSLISHKNLNLSIQAQASRSN